ncbi:polysaccharide lyase 6 family protein [Aporhodopirellula aestuarii]|uniref:Polysaccharide lyase 6 family protein n=1 Tax=Aporhodopirellula aestuarii TaxID=2950107 RepID=A0ABT0UED0_9BACT|nr:polysaccharide lyase 6 family protein [Aporhodopirellula aestuarii]MCM2374723.1 polysaccharide lyase 6 family protein [Aporhodopirellula aestuarii]
MKVSSSRIGQDFGSSPNRSKLPNPSKLLTSTAASAVVAIFLFLTAILSAVGNEHRVDSADELESLIESNRVKPGDTIVWADGEYKDVELNIEGADGTESSPIVLAAAHPGQVVFRGESQIRIGTRWWTIQGFHFAGGPEDVTNAYNTIQFRGNSGQAAEYVTLRDCALTNLRGEDDTSKWVLMYGRFNTIERCTFLGKKKRGALLTVELGELAADQSAEHLIQHNYFSDIAFQPGTDNETIRIGFSGDQNKSARCVVKKNLFVRCDGENEIISCKSSHNRFEANTFCQCNGALVLRHGHHAHVEGNYFFGDGATDSGGVRISDSHHVIVNNYFQDLTGTTWNAALSILGGKEPTGGSGNGYQAVDGIIVAHNTFVNCRRSILLSSEKGNRAPRGIFANNLVVSSVDALVKVDLPPDNLHWTGNLMFGDLARPHFASLTNDPELELVEGRYRPSEFGPAADRAVAIGMSVQWDVEGKRRPTRGMDIGADEVSGASGTATSHPLTLKDVGVSFPLADVIPAAR